MKKKMLRSLGLMSGTSMDGVDISIIESDGYNELSCIFNGYYEFDKSLYRELINLRDKILKYEDLQSYSEEIRSLDRKFTLFNGQLVNEIKKKVSEQIDLIGFHGQTIFHKASVGISKQLGDGKLLSQITKNKVVFNFRQNDLDHKGQGAPLTPIYHLLISNLINNRFDLDFPINIINIGGITNITQIVNKNFENLHAYDIGPGNCLIDEWIRNHTDKKFDKEGQIAKSGNVDELIFNQAVENFNIDSFDQSLDVKDFDLSFARGLAFEDGCATITKFSAYLISEALKKIEKKNNIKISNHILCGGGRKNKTLINNIESFFTGKKIKFKQIDEFDFNGDFIESQAFAYLAIRSLLKLPISFPNTTRCEKMISGGIIKKNF